MGEAAGEAGWEGAPPHTTGEVVERATFQSQGAIESDYRPNRWHNAREPYKFTGKEEDIEVGATYFGARYYNARLGRFMSADPLAIHGLGGDLNPYAYVGGRLLSHVDPFGLADEAVNAAAAAAQEAPPDNQAPQPLQPPDEGPAEKTVFEGKAPFQIQGTDHGPFPAELPLDNNPQSPLSPERGEAGGSGRWFPPPPGWTPSFGQQVRWTCQGECPTQPWDLRRLEILQAGVSPSPLLLAEKAVAEKLLLRAVPNPYGKLGGPAHQAKVSEVADAVRSRGLNAGAEYRVPTPGGAKGTRFVDVVGRDAQGNVVEMHQIGRQTKAGNPVAREVRALDDIQGATGVRPIFHPYD